MDSVNSTTFIKRPPSMSDAEEKFIYTKEILSGRIFLAQYEEKRYVPVLKEYRDVVIINPEETELMHDLDKIRKKWLGVENLKWVGITGPEDFGFPKGHCFWVKLTNLALGQYWFQIKHVRLVNQEIVYQLKCIRKSQTPSSAHTPENKKEVLNDVKNGLQALASANTSSSVFPYRKYQPPSSAHIQENKKEGLNDVKNGPQALTSANTLPSTFSMEMSAVKVFSAFKQSCITAINTIGQHTTWENFFGLVKAGCALLIVVVMGTIHMIAGVGDFSLKFLRELTILVKACSPIVIAVIDAFTKIIGGLFILIVGLCRGGNHRNYTQYSQILSSKPILFKPAQQTPVDWRERNRRLRNDILSSPEKFE